MLVPKYQQTPQDRDHPLDRHRVMAEAIDALMQRLEQAEMERDTLAKQLSTADKAGWRTDVENAPVMQEVLVCNPDAGPRSVIALQPQVGFWRPADGWGNPLKPSPTHWMPLPTPPEQKP